MEEGQILCIIEVMKLFNEIHAPVAGVVKRIVPEHAAGVEYDEVLMEIEPWEVSGVQAGTHSQPGRGRPANIESM